MVVMMKRWLLLGSSLPLVAGVAWAQQGTGVWEILAREPVYVDPKAKDFVDVAQIQAAAKRMEPTKLKVIVVPSLGKKWQRNGVEARGSFAKYAMTRKLGTKDAIVIVFTGKGIGSYSDRVGDATLARLNNEAKKHTEKDNFTKPILWLANNIYEAKETVETKRTVGFGTVAGIAGVGALVVVGGIAAAKAKRVADARHRAEKSRDRALDEISYLDSYTDLIHGTDGEAIRNYRERAFEQYEQGRVILEQKKSVEEYQKAERLFDASYEDSNLGRRHVDAATGGSKVAFTVPPRLDPSAPPAPPVKEAPLYEPYENVCYFCSKPGEGDLTQVQINLDGQRRSVMVCQDDLAEMNQGQTPMMRGRNVGGRFVPWYMVNGYNPYTMYGSSGWIWDMLAFNTLLNMFNPFWSPMAIHNYYGMGHGPMSYGGYSGGYDPNWNSHSNDFGVPMELDQSGDFGSGGWFGGDSGGGFGGGDFGGGDFGGGDFGGGDFGGGDFGGGDW